MTSTKATARSPATSLNRPAKTVAEHLLTAELPKHEASNSLLADNRDAQFTDEHECVPRIPSSGRCVEMTRDQIEYVNESISVPKDDDELDFRPSRLNGYYTVLD